MSRGLSPPKDGNAWTVAAVAKMAPAREGKMLCMVVEVDWFQRLVRISVDSSLPWLKESFFLTFYIIFVLWNEI
jgi:hypothetical protein